MAKKIQAYIKLQVKAGQANPSPPVGPALGQHGVNIMEFCKAFNARTQGQEAGLPTPVIITVYSDRSFTFETKSTPASVLLKKAAEAALAAGADRVGMDDLAAEMKGGDLNYDVVIASPDAMRVVGQLGQVLGPRGLMPNPKVGTVTPDVATAVKNAKAGQVRYRTDKNGIIHTSVGKIGFEADKLKENVEALIADLKRIKPASSKGIYVKRVTLSTTMGPGLVIDQSSLNV